MLNSNCFCGKLKIHERYCYHMREKTSDAFQLYFIHTSKLGRCVNTLVDDNKQHVGTAVACSSSDLKCVSDRQIESTQSNK